MSTAISKICVVCGQEVGGKRRTKDKQGNYYCQTCYDQRDTSGDSGALDGAEQDDTAARLAGCIPSQNISTLDDSPFHCPSCGGLFPFHLMHSCGVCNRCENGNVKRGLKKSKKESIKWRIGVVTAIVVLAAIAVVLNSDVNDSTKITDHLTVSNEVSQSVAVPKPPTVVLKTVDVVDSRTRAAPVQNDEQKLIAQRNFIYTFAADPPRHMELLPDGKFGVGPGGGQVGGGPTSFEQHWASTPEGIVISGAHGDYTLTAGPDGVMRGRISDLGFDVTLAPAQTARVASNPRLETALPILEKYARHLDVAADSDRTLKLLALKHVDDPRQLEGVFAQRNHYIDIRDANARAAIADLKELETLKLSRDELHRASRSVLKNISSDEDRRRFAAFLNF